MLLHAMENIKKVPLQTVQSHSFIEIEGPARCERVEENEKDKYVLSFFVPVFHRLCNMPFKMSLLKDCFLFHR